MSKTKGVLMTAAERKEKALALRKLGHSYAEIGKACGCSMQRAHTICSEYLRELNSRCNNSAEELRQLELEKLDAQELRLTKIILALPPSEIRHLAKFEDTLLKVRQQRARLLGLVTPTQVLVPVDTSQRGRVEQVVADPALAKVVGEAQTWEPPRLVLSEPAPAREGVG